MATEIADWLDEIQSWPNQYEAWVHTHVGVKTLLSVLHSGEYSQVFDLKGCYLVERIPLKTYYQQFEETDSQMAFWNTFTPAVQCIYALEIGAPIWCNLTSLRPLEGNPTDNFLTRWKLSLLNPDFALEILKALPPSNTLKTVIQESRLLIESFTTPGPGSDNCHKSSSLSHPEKPVSRNQRRARARKRKTNPVTFAASLLPMVSTMLDEFDENEIDRIRELVIAQLQSIAQQQRTINLEDIQSIFLKVYQDDDNVDKTADDLKECITTVQELVGTAMNGGDKMEAISKLMGLVDVDPSDLSNMLATLNETTALLPVEFQKLCQPILEQTVNMFQK